MSAELKSKSDISIVLFFFTALAVLGVAGGGFFAHDYARARASAAWPTADGIVLSQLEAESARVRYVYSMEGRSYESQRERVFLSRFLRTPSTEYRPGETVPVFVNPDDHAYSVLQPGGAAVAFVFLFLVSGFGVFFGVGGVIWALSRSTKPEFDFVGEAA